MPVALNKTQPSTSQLLDAIQSLAATIEKLEKRMERIEKMVQEIYDSSQNKHKWKVQHSYYIIMIRIAGYC